MTDHVDVAILGGGIAGLAAFDTLHKANRDALIVEAQDSLGGLLRSFEIDGFMFDHAVHLSFASEPEVREVFDQVPYVTHQPESLNWETDKWLRHPVQNNLFPLEGSDKLELISGLIDGPAAPEAPADYAEWLTAQYGAPIAERYPLRYTRKYWRTEAEQLGTDWIGQRMRRADLKEVLRGALTQDKSNTYYVREMRYPETGGYFSFIAELAQKARARLSSRVTGISLDRREIHFADGRCLTFNQLISTIRLPDLIQCIEEAPTALKTASEALHATEIDLISVGFNKPDVPPALWFYIYDEWIEAARAYSPSWKSPHNAPEGCSSLQFEIYSGPDETANRDPDYLIENTRQALAAMNLAQEDDILFVKHRRVKDGNVIFFKGMEETRDACLAWLDQAGIASAGRFGEWGYLWSNQAFMSGLNAAKRILG